MTTLHDRAGKLLYTYSEKKGQSQSLENTLLQACGRKKLLLNLDLSGSQIKDINLSGLKAPGINLDRAVLENVCLQEGNFLGGSVVGAKLVNVNLSDANVEGVDFSKAEVFTKQSH